MRLTMKQKLEMIENHDVNGEIKEYQRDAKMSVIDRVKKKLNAITV